MLINKQLNVNNGKMFFQLCLFLHYFTKRVFLIIIQKYNFLNSDVMHTTITCSNTKMRVELKKTKKRKNFTVKKKWH